jgi:hypothetical protein
VRAGEPRCYEPRENETPITSLFDILRFTLRVSYTAKALATFFPTVVPRSIWVRAHTPSFKMYWNSSGR